MANNFAEAMQQGYAFGANQRREREAERRRTGLASLAQQAYAAPPAQRQALVGQAIGLDPDAGFGLDKSLQGNEDRRQKELVQLAKGWKQITDPMQRKQYYEQFVHPAVSQMGFGDLGQYDESEVNGVAEQILAAYGGADANSNVQSTYIDAQGNRVAIMRDGTTAILGQNAPNNQIIDTGNGFYGVNRGNLSAAPVTVGGAQQTQPQGIGPGTYQTPSGIVRIGDLPPEMQQAALADIQSGANASEVQLPNRDVSPAQFGQQLRSAPKPQDGQFQTLSSQEIDALGLPQGTVAQRSPSGQVQIINKPRDLPTGGQVIDNGDGTTTYIPAGRITEGERNASGFYERMAAANDEMDRILQSGYDPTNRRDFYTAGGELLNPLASSEGQQYRQAQENWVRANLRKESGAAIGVAEMDQERKNYFPIPGDSPAVIAQKARNRQVTERAMRQAAGGGLAPPGNSQQQRAAAPARATQRARNPQTGEVLILVNGQWVPE